MGEEGLEPSHYWKYKILSLERLPITPLALMGGYVVLPELLREGTPHQLSNHLAL